MHVDDTCVQLLIIERLIINVYSVYHHAINGIELNIYCSSILNRE